MVYGDITTKAMKDKYDVVVASAFGIEGVTKRELIDMGIRDKILCREGRIRFCATLDEAIACCVRLRTAERVYLSLTSGPAEDFDQLFALVSAFPWRDYVPIDAKLSIEAKCVRSRLAALSAIQSVTKRAIVNTLSGSADAQLAENGADYRLQVYICDDICEILLDLCGSGLHRRGYRVKTVTAPIKETLAAAVLLLCGYDGQWDLYDPFCGSGTFLTEGICIASHISPGLDRRFALEHYPFIDKSILRNVKQQARSEIVPPECAFRGIDISADAIEISRFHADKLGVADKIEFTVGDATTYIPSTAGLTVTNPPYGERLLSRRQTEALYRALSNVMRRYPEGHRTAIVTAFDGCERILGTPRSTRKLFNGNIPCRMYQYQHTTRKGK